jgi:hypothetical protein
MKHFVVVLALVLSVSLGVAQDYVYVNPVISTTTVTNCTTAVGSMAIVHADSGFKSIYAGMRVYGVGVPYGATVAYSDSLDSLALSSAITQGGAKSLQFGVFEGTDYTSGDWVGFPFLVYSNPGDGGAMILESVQITDNGDMLDDIDLVLFNAYSDTLGLDNAAAAIRAVDAPKVVGGLAFTSDTDLGTARSVQYQWVGLVVPKEALYGRLIARSALAPIAINNLRIRFGFR